MLNKIISNGERYIQNSVKIKISKFKICKIIFCFLIICEIVLGVLWALGF